METTNELLAGGVEYAAAQVIVRNGSMFLRWECEVALKFGVIISPVCTSTFKSVYDLVIPHDYVVYRKSCGFQSSYV